MGSSIKFATKSGREEGVVSQDCKLDLQVKLSLVLNLGVNGILAVSRDMGRALNSSDLSRRETRSRAPAPVRFVVNPDLILVLSLRT